MSTAHVIARRPHRLRRASSNAFLLFVVVSLTVAGCVARSPIREDQYQRALALVDQGTLLMREGRFAEADASFSLAYEVAPLAAALDGQGCVALFRGEWDRAERFFKEAYMMDDGYDEAAANLALLLDARGEPERARELYRWYLERHPEDAAVRNNMAALEFDQGGDKGLILQELMRAAAVSRHGAVADNITRLENSRGSTW